MTRSILKSQMEKLFALLRRVEEQERTFTARALEELVKAETGYKQKTWTTYRSKILDNVLIFSDEGDPVLLRVRGAVAMTTARFAEVMTQSKKHGAALPIATEDEWRDRLRSLAAVGRERKFMLMPEDRNLFLALFEKQRSLF